MTHAARFDAAFAECPLIAILRGIRPEEALAVGRALCESGFRIIEVPLNSPDPFESIGLLARHLGDRAVVGAGTVTSPEDVGRLKRAGASLVISPHADPDVIRAAVGEELVCVPGVLSPSEAFAALRAGAHALKLFPMEMIGAEGVKALRAVLPPTIRLVGVGGVTAQTIPVLRAAGCSGFGLGSSLYRPGASPDAVASAARHAWRAYQSAHRG